MAQVKLVLVAAALLALLAVAMAVPARYRLDDGHAVSDSSSDSSDSSDSSSSESKEEHNRKRLPASNVPVSNMEPGQPWESHYKHGLAPAKLPAQETDNAHSYRHSIIHPYGADLHA